MNLKESWSSQFGVRGEQSDYLRSFERFDPERFHTVVVARIPVTLSHRQFQTMYEALTASGCFPLCFSGDSMEHIRHSWNWWPTDEFRQIDRSVVCFNERILQPVTNALSMVGGRYTVSHYIDEAKQKTQFRRFGHDCQVVESQKLAVVAQVRNIYDRLVGDNEKTYTHFQSFLEQMGYSVLSVQTEGVEMFEGFTVDLDQVFFPFAGRDGALHAIVARSFRNRVFDECIVHEISDESALLGGCNVADIAQGTIFLSPHRDDAPQTYEILSEWSDVPVIELPQGYMEGGGGPRCLTSSITWRDIS